MKLKPGIASQVAINSGLNQTSKCLSAGQKEDEMEDPLEKGMASHASILARDFRGQRSLAGYSPYGCKRVRRNSATKTTNNKYYV